MIGGAEATVIAGIVGGGSAVLTAGLVTVGSYIGTNRSVAEIKAEGDRQRGSVEQERRLDREHEWALAAEERRQKRRRDAYVAIQTYVSGWCSSAEWRIRNYETDPPTPAPEMTSLDSELMAAVELQASDPVIDLLTEFSKQVRLLLVAIGSYVSAQTMVDPQLPGSAEQAREFRTAMETAANRVMDGGKEIRRVMREELKSDDPR